MEQKLKRVYKSISQKHPSIGTLLKRCYYKRPFNRIKHKIRGKNNRIRHGGAMLSGVTFDISGNDNNIEIGENCILNHVVFYVRGNGHTLVINSGCRFNRGGSIWFEDQNCSLVIGKNSTFEDAHLALTEPNSTMTIGNDCLFAYDIDVRTGDSHSIISKSTNERINYAENVFIGDHVWVAAHSILLKGSIIPNDSIVATGSVVTKKFTQDGILIGGNPAKQLKNGITWSRERLYKAD